MYQVGPTMATFPHPYYVVSDQPRKCSGLNPCCVPLGLALKMIVVYEIINTAILATISKTLVICILNGADVSDLPDVIITFFISNFYLQNYYWLEITIVLSILIVLQLAFLGICLILLCKPSNILCIIWTILYLTIWIGPIFLSVAIADIYETILCVFPSIITVAWFTWTVVAYGKHMKKVKLLERERQQRKFEKPQKEKTTP